MRKRALGWDGMGYTVGTEVYKYTDLIRDQCALSANLAVVAKTKSCFEEFEVKIFSMGEKRPFE